MSSRFCPECGKLYWAYPSQLKEGKGKYCSVKCYNLNRVGPKTHGQTGAKLYKVWISINQRCNNPNDKEYHNYGERGIIMCEEWKKSFPVFRDWAVENGYEEGLEIDRKENDGNYEPDNCRWVTKAQNNWNRGKLRNKETTSKYKGVSWDKDRCEWAVRVNLKGKNVFGGRFANEEDAARRYDELATKYFGEFARLNFGEKYEEVKCSTLS